jgi:hypothetical protein
MTGESLVQSLCLRLTVQFRTTFWLVFRVFLNAQQRSKTLLRLIWGRPFQNTIYPCDWVFKAALVVQFILFPIKTLFTVLSYIFPRLNLHKQQQMAMRELHWIIFITPKLTLLKSLTCKLYMGNSEEKLSKHFCIISVISISCRRSLHGD